MNVFRLLAFTAVMATLPTVWTQAQMSVPPAAPDLSGYVTPTDLSSAAAGNLTLMQGQIQASAAITMGSGDFAGTWKTPFAAPPTGYLADIPDGGTAPFKCSVQTVTATSFTGHCWQLVATTLPASATALLGLTISPIQNAAAGLTVRVVGRQ